VAETDRGCDTPMAAKFGDGEPLTRGGKMDGKLNRRDWLGGVGALLPLTQNLPGQTRRAWACDIRAQTAGAGVV